MLRHLNKKNPMGIFFTSDQHFFHKNIIKLCNRPFKDLEEMHEKIIDNWNSVVKENDTVVCVGDFSFGSKEKTKDILTRLKGKKRLVVGNHDRKSHYGLFESAMQSCYGRDYPLSLFKIGLGHFRVQHIPDHVNTGFLLHGHVHHQWKFHALYPWINVGVDVWDFTPVNMDDIRKLLQERRIMEESSQLHFRNSILYRPSRKSMKDELERMDYYIRTEVEQIKKEEQEKENKKLINIIKNRFKHICCFFRRRK